jgi:methionine synthase I (cobalamin-dependent)
MFARVGADILLEAGYFDLLELKEALEAARSTGLETEATLVVRHRLHLQPRVLRQLVTAANEILAGIPADEE